MSQEGEGGAPEVEGRPYQQGPQQTERPFNEAGRPERNYQNLRDASEPTAATSAASEPPTPDRLFPQMGRPERQYEILSETHQQVQPKSEAPAQPARPQVFRRWTDRGDRVSNERSANVWHRQNLEIKRAMSDSGTGNDRQTEETQAAEAQREAEEHQAAVQEAIARQEAREQARQRERSQGMSR